MTFNSEISLGNVIAAAGFFVAAAGLFLTLYQLRRDSRRKRAEFILSVFNQYLTDPDTASSFYSIDYGKFQYGPDFRGSKEERHLDRLLTYFEMIATLDHLGVVARADLELIRYQFVRVYKNDEVQKYFAFLDGFCREYGPFRHFRVVAAILTTQEDLGRKTKGIPGR